MKLTKRLKQGIIGGAVIATLAGSMYLANKNGSFEAGQLRDQVERVADKDNNGITTPKEWKSVYDAFGKGNMFIEKCSDPYGMNHSGQYLSINELKEYLADN